MTNKEKLRTIMNNIKLQHPFEKQRHRVAKHDDVEIGYYYDNPDYFDVTAFDITINVNGNIRIANLDKYSEFEMERWLNTLLAITERKENEKNVQS